MSFMAHCCLPSSPAGVPANLLDSGLRRNGGGAYCRDAWFVVALRGMTVDLEGWHDPLPPFNIAGGIRVDVTIDGSRRPPLALLRGE